MPAFTPQLFVENVQGRVQDIIVSPCRSQAVVFNALYQWHDLPAVPAGWRIAFAFYLHDSLVGVATWGRPVARYEDYKHTLELTRHALAPNCPRNTATWTLGKMRKYIKHNMSEFIRLISYCDMQRHHGTMYKADNWVQIGTMEYEGIGWNNRAGRVEGSQRAIKTKWERNP